MIITAAAAVSWIGVGIDPGKLAQAANLFLFLQRDWLPPDWSVLLTAIRESVITIEIAFLSTLFASYSPFP